MSQLVLKATFGEETHRVSLNAPFSYAAVRAAIANFFPQLDSFRINYRDEDGDCITVATDTDILEASRFFGKQPLKFTIVAAAKVAPVAEAPVVVPANKPSVDAPVYSVSTLSIGAPVNPAPVPAPAPVGPVRLQARFVRDVTVPDGSCFSLQAAFRKTWLIRNAGECPWPSDCVLRFEAGDQLGGVATTVPAAQPNQDVEISVDFRCPNKEGKYVSYWRLCNAEGIVFGDRIWSEIRVEKSAPAPAAPEPAPAPAPAVAPVATPFTFGAPATAAPAVAPVVAPFTFGTPQPQFAYQAGLDQLKTMGFPDNDRVRRTLIRHRGDVNITAQSLLDT